MLAVFSAVDIKHLISLDLRSMRTSKLLLVANSQTLQKFHYCCMADELQEDHDILAGNTSLRAIEVVDYNADMAYTLNAFGNLHHLTALKTISLHFTEG
ncbi:hypothetical protein C8J57DRAFT_1721078 [Mycena rebaudengoi]|nr:hypothetical protein C8J57DRAFT_1721078 [Mycena rebaudengoi]